MITYGREQLELAHAAPGRGGQPQRDRDRGQADLDRLRRRQRAPWSRPSTTCVATDSARAGQRRGRGDERPEARGRRAGSGADRARGDEILELGGGAHVEGLVEDAVERAVDQRADPGGDLVSHVRTRRRARRAHAAKRARGIAHQRVDTHQLQHDQPVDRTPQHLGDLVGRADEDAGVGAARHLGDEAAERVVRELRGWRPTARSPGPRRRTSPCSGWRWRARCRGSRWRTRRRSARGSSVTGLACIAVDQALEALGVELVDHAVLAAEAAVEAHRRAPGGGWRCAAR